MRKGALAALALGLLGAVHGSSCSVDEIDLKGKKCPCAPGWECNDAGTFCIEKKHEGGTDSSTGGKKDGGGGSFPTGGSSNGGSGGTGVGGLAGSGNFGGALGGSGGCPVFQKDCGGTCVSTDPAHGCSSSDCSPCADPGYANATLGCPSGLCGPQCNSGFGNCNGDDSDGCEASLDSPSQCGQCGKACSTANGVAPASCTGGQCSLTCNSGFADCISFNIPDDGCETEVATSTNNCGACGNSCSARGGIGAWACNSGSCGCLTTSSCQSSNNVTGASCNPVTHVCSCSLTICNPGEICIKQGNTAICRCNGSTKCFGSTICCSAGCVDPMSDPSNCGGCNRQCGSGQSCSGGSCI